MKKYIIWGGMLLLVSIIMYVTVSWFMLDYNYKHCANCGGNTKNGSESLITKIPEVNGYYTPVVDAGDSYILVKQVGKDLTIKGYTSSANISGDKNIGYFEKNTSIEKNNTATIDVSLDQNDPCLITLFFYHRPTIENNNAQELNSIRIVQTNSGTSCGFGNNVSFDLENLYYQKRSTTPEHLPTGGENTP